MKPAQGILHVFDDAAALALGAADWLTGQALATSERFVVALSGGSTPKPVYEALGSAPLAQRFPWERAFFCIGDERFVPVTDPASNWRMIQEAMLAHVPAPASNLFPVQTEAVTIDQAASAYEATLRMIHGGGVLDAAHPLFDVTFLGLGDDGHTASLLPGQPVLDVVDRWVAVVAHGRAEERITLTYPALNASRNVAFLVSGAAKASVLDHVLSGGMDVPAARLDVLGEVHWFLDRAAAGSRA